MKKKAIIISIKNIKLSKKEKLLLSKEKPWGLILFKRNVKSFNQLKALISEIRKLTKDKKFPIMIDEEGISVSRLRNIINHNVDANYFGNLYKINKKVAISLYENYLDSLCKNLQKIGININTIPVLDVLRKNTNKVIGKRSFSENKIIVKKLGERTIRKCHFNIRRNICCLIPSNINNVSLTSTNIFHAIWCHFPFTATNFKIISL